MKTPSFFSHLKHQSSSKIQNISDDMASAILVPISVQVLCIGTTDSSNKTFVGPSADFSDLAWKSASGTLYNQNIPPLAENMITGPFSQDNNITLGQGVHVQWSIPHALRHSYVTTEATTEVPPAPNRWLVIRSVLSSGSNTNTAWILESNYMNDTSSGNSATPGDNQPNSPTIPSIQANSGPTFRYLGQFNPVEGWVEPETGVNANYLPTLTAYGYGNPSFSNTYHNTRNVFGFYDDSVPASETTLSYTILGWHSLHHNDPLSSTQIKALFALNPQFYMDPQKTTFENALALRGWQLSSSTSLEYATTFYHGTILGIEWNPGTTYLSDSPTANVTLTLGETVEEALSTIITDTVDPGGLDSSPMPLFLNALQCGILSQMGSVNGIYHLYDMIHQKQFQGHAPGVSWVVRSTNSASNVIPTLSPALRTQIDSLANIQAQLNAANVELLTFQELIFCFWVNYMMASYPATPSQMTILQFMQIFVGSTSADLSCTTGCQSYYCTLSNQISSLETEVGNAITAINALLNPLQCILKSIPEARYWKPKDPVLLFSGPDALRTLSPSNAAPKGALAVRVGNQLLTSITTPSNGSFTIAESEAIPGLGAIPFQDLLNSLSQEAGMLIRLGNAVGFGPVMQTLQASTIGAGEVIPDASAVTAWDSTTCPWIPVIMEWELQYLPVGMNNNCYSSDFLANSFAYDAESQEYQWTTGAVDMTQSSTYYGSTLLSPTIASLTGPIQSFLKTNADPALQALITQLEQLPILAQTISGMNNAFLQRQQIPQFPVIDPTPQLPVTDSFSNTYVQQAVGTGNCFSPIGSEVYSPIRAGYAMITQLRIIDAFGRFKTVPSSILESNTTFLTTPNLYNPSWTAGSNQPLFLFKPRLLQASRLQFRWIAADSDMVEAAAIPEATPVCGWVMPNYLDNNVFVYDTKGVCLGYLALDDTQSTITFYPPPGTNTAPTVSNPHLQNYLNAIIGNNATFFSDWMILTHDAMEEIAPDPSLATQSISVLLGRPLAIVRARFRLELEGLPAIDQSQAVFTAAITDTNFSSEMSAYFTDPVNGVSPYTHGLMSVSFPVYLGAADQLNDGLIGYYVESNVGVLGTFFSPLATAAMASGISPTGDEISLSANPTDETILTLLMDPRVPIHARTGILPTKAISIPTIHYEHILKGLSVMFVARPVLTSDNAIKLPLPSDISGTWSFVENTPSGWTETSISKMPSESAEFSSNGIIRNGWLKISTSQ